MESFRSFIEQQEFVDKVLCEFDNPQLSGEVWSAKKPDILQMWQNTRQDMPINITPVSKEMGSNNRSYGEDGIRITGSWAFISSVLGRIKDVLAYENPNTRLRLVFRGVDQERSRSDRQSFVFYVNVEQRSKNQKQKKIELAPPQV